MFIDDLKIAVDKTKKFVKQHPTATACAVSAIVASKITHSVTSGHYTEMIEACGRYLEAMDQAGQAVTLQRDVLLDFVNENDLKDDVIQFIHSKSK